MIQNVLREIGGIGLYGVISICLFFAVFCTAVLIALNKKPSELTAAGHLPLEGDEPCHKNS